MSPPLAQAVAAFSAMLYLERRTGSKAERSKPAAPWSSRQGSWRMGGKQGRAKRKLSIHGTNTGDDDDDNNAIECISNPDGSFDITVPSRDDTTKQVFHVNGGMLDENSSEMQLEINHTTKVRLTCILREEKGKLDIKMWPKNVVSSSSNSSLENYAWQVLLDHPLSNENNRVSKNLETYASGNASGKVKSPMPGKISRINFRVGDKVAQGDVILVMEAMKMEHAIRAPVNGIVQAINHQVGDLVGDDALLFDIDHITNQ